MHSNGNDGTGGEVDSSSAAGDDSREGGGGDKINDGDDGGDELDENEHEMGSDGRRPSSSQPTTTTPEMKTVRDDSDLLRRGICRVSINGEEDDYESSSLSSPSPPHPFVDLPRWSVELSRVTPEILTAQSDGEYAFYRNIMDNDPPFPPLKEILRTPRFVEALRNHFGVNDPEGELRLDDAFCVHYDVDNQDDTGGALHVDPSDITVNMCLEKGDGVRGSEVMFIGTRTLSGLPPDGEGGEEEGDGGAGGEEEKMQRFLVEQMEGYATLHWGDHPHQTMPMLRVGEDVVDEDSGAGNPLSKEAGSRRRTNVILTYCYRDPSRSDVATRSCYFVE